MKKKIIIVLSVFFGLLVVLFVLSKTTKPKSEEYVEDYFIDNGYVKEDGSAFYIKQVSKNTLDQYSKNVLSKKSSSFEALYFDSLGLDFIKQKMDYSNEIGIIFTGNHNFKGGKITYTYEIDIYSSSLILSGEYKKGKDGEKGNITCKVEVENGIDSSNKDVYCAKAEYEMLLFLEEINNLKKDSRFRDILKEPIKEYKEDKE